MPVPWNQIVQLMPSVIDVSKELLRRTRTPEKPAAQSLTARPVTAELEERISTMEDNERRQAVLSTQMAEQLAQLTVAVTSMHRQLRWLVVALAASTLLSVAALVVALR